MPRYIDADAFRQRMYHEAFETDTDMQKWDSGCWIRYKLFENCIDEQPTISPEEVRGVGEWEHQELAPTNWTFCSVCGRQRSKKYKWYYCPNCGARLRNGGTDDS